MNIVDIDKISERLIGWGCIVGAITEYVNPAILALDSSQASGMAVFGFLVATGRAGALVKKLGEVLSRD